jgi:hypothetical protein
MGTFSFLFMMSSRYSTYRNTDTSGWSISGIRNPNDLCNRSGPRYTINYRSYSLCRQRVLLCIRVAADWDVLITGSSLLRGGSRELRELPIVSALLTLLFWRSGKSVRRRRRKYEWLRKQPRLVQPLKCNLESWGTIPIDSPCQQISYRNILEA